MQPSKLVKFHDEHLGPTLGLCEGATVIALPNMSLTAWLTSSVGRVAAAIQELAVIANASQTRFKASRFDNPPAECLSHWLAPIDDQEVWAAGVTYERSRAARQEEAQDGGDVYARVYSAERPELFFKARGRNVVGHLGAVGIRADANWNVPEAELAVVMNPAGEVLGFSAANDVSSRDIEGANPLYLPQAKVYTASCALGNSIFLQPASEWPNTLIQLNIMREDQQVFSGKISTERIKRSLDELVTYLFRSNSYPDGVVLLTGTGIVPPADFSLHEGDVAEIVIDEISVLRNTVMIV